MSETQWRLRDVDNRGPDGEPHEVTGAPKDLIAYLDGPVRRDLIGAQGAELLTQLIAACNDGDMATARTVGPKLSIYTEEVAP
ncbi:hypothetical protein SEA_BLINO_67 [Gordonia phage Blino]|uniref:Uncharacterized protein n=1 Tax=Gordonia phage Blino TaxID=2793696 RepID=A0A7T0Q3B8_9CAUD|nr:hypothetical protein BIZ75_gp66 [Gordonia phage CarolAnn]YP_010114156.1 hypothetical protein KNV70_gp67 [Gordonia phage Blino]AOE44083.1 hypothetical protein SEA_CAROLANN_66 [Gordonia phage CarolAnn]QPL14015.1 hypothetical protein SEA_BLINO_67 [Gordonia phage Blino]